MTETPSKQPKKPLDGSVAAQVVQTVERLGLSEAQAAQYFAVPVFTVRKWLTGEREPGAAVARLLEVMGLLEALAPNIHQSFLVNLAPRPVRGRRVTPKPPEHNLVMSGNPLTESQS
jgi:hypothetical protein